MEKSIRQVSARRRTRTRTRRRTRTRTRRRTRTRTRTRIRTRTRTRTRTMVASTTMRRTNDRSIFLQSTLADIYSTYTCIRVLKKREKFSKTRFTVKSAQSFPAKCNVRRRV